MPGTIRGNTERCIGVMMTAADTIEYAQSSVDQIQRGLELVQDQLEKADAFAVKADELAQTAGEFVVKARRISRAVLILGGLAVIGGTVAIVLIRRRRNSRGVDVDAEIVT